MTKQSIKELLQNAQMTKGPEWHDLETKCPRWHNPKNGQNSTTTRVSCSFLIMKGKRYFIYIM